MALAEGIEWVGHGKTKFRCCSTWEAAINRTKIAVVRNPYSKMISSFMHPSICGEWCTSNWNADAVENFTSWYNSLVKKYPTDVQDTFNHFKCQASQFRDSGLSRWHDSGTFFHVHLETVEKDWQLLENHLRTCHNYQPELLPLPLANSRNANMGSDVALLNSTPEVVKMIASRCAQDFELFGYNTDITDVMPKTHDREDSDY